MCDKQIVLTRKSKYIRLFVLHIPTEWMQNKTLNWDSYIGFILKGEQWTSDKSDAWTRFKLDFVQQIEVMWDIREDTNLTRMPVYKIVV